MSRWFNICDTINQLFNSQNVTITIINIIYNLKNVNLSIKRYFNENKQSYPKYLYIDYINMHDCMFSDSDRKFRKYLNKLFSNIKILIKILSVIFLKNEMNFQKIAFRIFGHVPFAQTNTLKKSFFKIFTSQIRRVSARAVEKNIFF